MNFAEYFKNRSDMIEHILLKEIQPSKVNFDWRYEGIGLMILAVATAAELWASLHIADAGFFVRTSTFLWGTLIIGGCLMIAAQAANFFVARFSIGAREDLTHKVLTQLLKIDSALAHKLIEARRNP